VGEVAEGQGVTEAAIRWHVQQGHIPHVKRGARVPIPRKAYEAQLAGAGGGAAGLGAALGWEREELRAFLKEAVQEALREMFGLLAAEPGRDGLAPRRLPRC